MRTRQSAVNLVVWTLVVLLLVFAFVMLGRWQWQRTYRPVDGYSAEPAAVSLETLVPTGVAIPATAVARQVTVTGDYVTTGQEILRGSLAQWSGCVVGGDPARADRQDGGARRPRLDRRDRRRARNPANLSGFGNRADRNRKRSKYWNDPGRAVGATVRLSHQDRAIATRPALIAARAGRSPGRPRAPRVPPAKRDLRRPVVPARAHRGRDLVAIPAAKTPTAPG